MVEVTWSYQRNSWEWGYPHCVYGAVTLWLDNVARVRSGRREVRSWFCFYRGKVVQGMLTIKEVAIWTKFIWSFEDRQNGLLVSTFVMIFESWAFVNFEVCMALAIGHQLPFDLLEMFGIYWNDCKSTLKFDYLSSSQGNHKVDDDDATWAGDALLESLCTQESWINEAICQMDEHLRWFCSWNAGWIMWIGPFCIHRGGLSDNLFSFFVLCLW